MVITKIYFDACCLNRPFDNQIQDRVKLETEAIVLILKHIKANEWSWIGSEILNFEINQTPDLERKNRLNLLANFVCNSILIEEKETKRAQELEKLGFHSFDALHLACAETANVDIFLTTDDKLLKLALPFI